MGSLPPLLGAAPNSAGARPRCSTWPSPRYSRAAATGTATRSWPCTRFAAKPLEVAVPFGDVDAAVDLFADVADGPLTIAETSAGSYVSREAFIRARPVSEHTMDDRAWDRLYAAPLDVLERAFLDALEQIKDDERSLGDKVIAFLEAARRPDTAT
jgi:hypothetical protein